MATSKPNKPIGKFTNAKQYIAALPEARREIVQTLHNLIRKSAPGLKPCIVNNVPGLGYGPYHYRYASGREGDTATIGLVSQKQHLSLYICAADETGYLAERYRERLPRADMGKSCIRFKRLEDLDLDVIRELVEEAARVGHINVKHG